MFVFTQGQVDETRTELTCREEIENKLLKRKRKYNVNRTNRQRCKNQKKIQKKWRKGHNRPHLFLTRAVWIDWNENLVVFTLVHRMRSVFMFFCISPDIFSRLFTYLSFPSVVGSFPFPCSRFIPCKLILSAFQWPFTT